MSFAITPEFVQSLLDQIELLTKQNAELYEQIAALTRLVEELRQILQNRGRAGPAAAMQKKCWLFSAVIQDNLIQFFLIVAFFHSGFSIIRRREKHNPEAGIPFPRKVLCLDDAEGNEYNK